MSILDYAFVLAMPAPPSIWNFYPTMEAAVAAQAEVNAKQNATYQPMTYEAYKAIERVHWLTPESRTTEAKFMEMLGVLPPMKWEHKGNFESFLMSEMTSGVYTEQYARRGSEYFCKCVDATDRKTWIAALAYAALPDGGIAWEPDLAAGAQDRPGDHPRP